METKPETFRELIQAAHENILTVLHEATRMDLERIRDDIEHLYGLTFALTQELDGDPDEEDLNDFE